MKLCWDPRPKACSISQCTGLASLMLATILLFVGPATATAFPTYSEAGDATNCRACHGDYRARDYVSLQDATPWSASLMDGHKSMLDNDCDFCHGPTRFPVALNSSNLGLGCLECHGRFEPEASGKITGSGLRQHHDRSGVTLCRTCHDDADPAAFSTAGEKEPPPFYRRAAGTYTSGPSNACNMLGSESTVAPPLGLDNDGDLAYDAADSDCSVTAAHETIVTPRLALIGVLPNPISSGIRRLQVLFALPNAGPATLELFDIRGRLVARRHIPEASFGRNAADLGAPRGAVAGVYLLRLTHAGNSLTKKVVMMK